jgi:aminocarboxymuconate-semialdehyde decarboxylase
MMAAGTGAVDIHGHYVIPELLKREGATESWRYEYGIDEQGRALLRRGSDSVPCFYEPIDVEQIVENMDALRISMMAINVAPFQIGYDLDPATGSRVARIGNEALAEVCSAHPDRFVGMGTLPMQDVESAITELEWVKAAGMAGVQLGSNVNGVYLGDESLRPIWNAISDLDASVFVHPVNLLGSERLGDYFLANLIGNPVDSTRSIADVIFSGLLEEFPGLRICFAHAGGAAPYLLGRWDHGYLKRPTARGKIDRLPSDYFRMLYFDHIAHSDLGLRFLIDLVGPDRVMIGTDYPFDMGPDEPVGFIEEASGVSVEEKRLITSENARRFLGLEP